MNQPAVKKPSVIAGIFGQMWKIIDFARRFFSAIIVLFLVFFVIIGLFAGEPPVIIQSGSALLLKPNGSIVTQLTHKDPIEEALNNASNESSETLLSDVLMAIEESKSDDRIKAIVLSTNNFTGASIPNLQAIRDALVDFKTSGKKIYAYGDWYGQSQYYLAAQADEVYVNPEGGVSMLGLGRFGIYFKKALEKFKVNVHVFRVGKFKSAVEPYLRDDMSEEAKEANRAWLGDLWSEFKQDIANARGLTPDDIQSYVDNALALHEENNGDVAMVALNNNLVDGLRTRIELNEYLTSIFGKGDKEKSFKFVHFEDYVRSNTTEFGDVAGDKIAVITAKGTIENGYRKPGTIGDRSLSKLIQKARDDKSVKALVLQVDSPGGSASASEFIRQELLKTKSEKPVIISMAGLAASGGYWISANANEIWARPTTITGSIGIFGMMPTFEKAAGEFLGITVDGVGTTKFAGANNALVAMNPEFGQVIQSSVNHGYEQFLSIVGEGRNMTRDQVDAIAQGRVWSGKKALELGLVDKLGDLDDAIASAAEKAGLTDYSVDYLQQEEKPMDKLMRQILNSQIAVEIVSQVSPQPSRLEKQIQQIIKQTESVLSLTDPKYTYAHCMCSAE